IDSVLAQNFTDFELLISDNCSPDNTADVVGGYDDPRIRYVRHETNLGANPNFNFCVEDANGEYLLLLSDDDLIDPDFLQSCVDSLQGKDNIGFVRTGARTINKDNEVIWNSPNDVADHTPRDLYLAWFTNKTAVYLCSVLFNVAALKSIGGLSSKHNLLEDGYAIVRLVNDYDWVDIKEIKSSFRQYPEQRTFSFPVKEWCEEFVGLLALMERQVEGDIAGFRDLGMRFFRRLSKQRVSAIVSPWKRIKAKLTVTRFFGWKTYLRPLIRLVRGQRSVAEPRGV
ncbi:MAG: glycosyltransferase, partial [Pseudomonadota bacterium]